MMCQLDILTALDELAALRPSREPQQRFMAKVTVLEDGCWRWGGAIQSNGYGSFGKGGAGRAVLAHRWAYENWVGLIAGRLEVDHLCHSRSTTCAGGKDCLHRRCVNPDHLEPVTRKVNASRSVPARKTHCAQGHLFDAANTRRNSHGHRKCRTCQLAYQCGWRLRRKAQLVNST